METAKWICTSCGSLAVADAIACDVCSLDGLRFQANCEASVESLDIEHDVDDADSCVSEGDDESSPGNSDDAEFCVTTTMTALAESPTVGLGSQLRDLSRRRRTMYGDEACDVASDEDSGGDDSSLGSDACVDVLTSFPAVRRKVLCGTPDGERIAAPDSPGRSTASIRRQSSHADVIEILVQR
jgi:hypothetical protein